VRRNGCPIAFQKLATQKILSCASSVTTPALFLNQSFAMRSFFTPVSWSVHTNIYEVNLRQYTTEGTFVAFSKELYRLRDMGVETLWFMPITPISELNKKGTLGSYYACSSYVNTNKEFGSIKDFKKLVEEAHRLGFKVIIDWVANHTGWDHEWTTTNPDFFVQNDKGQFVPPVENWEDTIKLDFNNKRMRLAMIAAMEFWVRECNIDGFRCDMAHLVTLDFWKQARTHLDSIKKLFWLAECEETNYHEAFDATYTWHWMHESMQFYRKHINLQQLMQVLERYHTDFPPQAQRVFFTSNHDENSWTGTEFEKYGDAVKLLAVFNCTWQGIPMLYSGQEMPNHKRLKFFDKDAIEWNGRYEFHDFYKRLLKLHSIYPALGADSSTTTIVLKNEADKFVLSYLRKKDDREVLVLLNMSDADKSFFSITDDRLKGKFTNLFSGNESDFTHQKYFALRPWEYLVYVKK
jgi:glycosidase